MARISLKREELRKLRDLKGGDLQKDGKFAELIGVHPAQLSRVLSGQSAPGVRFIAGCLEYFGSEFFVNLFEVVSDDDANDKGGNE